ncbi:MAG: hypothetical protein A2293_12140 [Elusimicrobia bacterium RIFOXYB2_FULL_49_7]|nr:MAG: hypothetical protein A2293_12140 [Elusimicrobia bacterium RIFOXYB2_FULL_49_7]
MSLLTRYEPQVLSGWLDDFLAKEGWIEPRTLAGTYPVVEVHEEKDHFKLIAEVPGVAKEDLKVSVKNGVLTLSGEKKLEKKEERKGYFYSERSYGRFERTFNLGENISEENVEASFKNGLLEVQLRKNEEKQSREVVIQ